MTIGSGRATTQGRDTPFTRQSSKRPGSTTWPGSRPPGKRPIPPTPLNAHRLPAISGVECTSYRAKFERYQAEALAFQHVPVNALQGIVCNGANEEASLKEMVHNSAVALTVQSLPAWYL